MSHEPSLCCLFVDLGELYLFYRDVRLRIAPVHVKSWVTVFNSKNA